MKTWKLLVEVDSCPEMGFPGDMDPTVIMELVKEALQDGGFDNDMSARVRLFEEPVRYALINQEERECGKCREPGCAGC